MSIKREDKVKEAARRMRSLGVFEEYVKSFENGGKIEISEPPMGVLYWIDDKLQAQVDEFEKFHDAVVYLVVRSFTTLGVMDSFFYVSDYEEEWEDDRKLLKKGETYAYVFNQDDDFGEVGSIGFRMTQAGGVLRAW